MTIKLSRVLVFISFLIDNIQRPAVKYKVSSYDTVKITLMCLNLANAIVKS